MVEASVIIPTRGRPDQLLTCLRALDAQRLDADRFEVLVGFDGPDPVSVAALRCGPTRYRLRVIACERSGIAAVKNRLIEEAVGRYLVFLNDDVEPEVDFLQRHLEAQAALDVPAMIVGHSPWAPVRNASQFDALIARTSMIFFYDRMIGASDARTRNWGFRHAWNLNLSVLRDEVAAVGGFNASIANCCYEDVELGYRLQQQRGLPVWFRPEAVAPHDHRYTPESYLEREFRLGYSALGLFAASPECALAIFGADLTDAAELEYARRYVEHESRREAEMLDAFKALASRPADAWPGDDWLALAYAQHLPLKRLAFRRGLLAAAESQEVEDLFPPQPIEMKSHRLARQAKPASPDRPAAMA